MIVVIIAGGSGTRLWPLSQADYPKHLLKLTGDRSLLQNTYDRASRLTDQIYVVTEKSHSAEVARQLNALDSEHVIVEPGRRGTASCIVLALSHIAKREEADQPIVFLHADHHISDDEAFAETVTCAAKQSERQNAITVVGIRPTYPATGLGYIKTGKEIASHDDFQVYHVEGFKEKPDLDTAKRYIEDGGFLWNQGLFAAPLEVWIDSFTRAAPDLADAYSRLESLTDKEKLIETYLSLESQPIDTALIEKLDNLVVVAGTFDWADIGSFFDLHKILQNADRNALRGDISLIECEDVMVHGYNKPIVAIGLSGVVVVDSPDGLLVCAKDKSQLVGEAAKILNARKKS